METETPDAMNKVSPPAPSCPHQAFCHGDKLLTLKTGIKKMHMQPCRTALRQSNAGLRTLANSEAQQEMIGAVEGGGAERLGRNPYGRGFPPGRALAEEKGHLEKVCLTTDLFLFSW